MYRFTCCKRSAAVMGALAALIVVVGCESNPALRKTGMDAFAAGDMYTARSNFAKAVDQDWTDWKSQFYLGRVYLELSLWLDAQLSLEKALALRRDEAETPMIIDHLAESLARQNRRDRLATMLTDACKQYGTVHDFMRQGKYLARIEDVDGAVVAYRKAARFSESDIKPYVAIADLYESIDDHQRAIEALRQAHAIEPLNPRIKDRLRGYGVVPGPTAEKEPDE